MLCINNLRGTGLIQGSVFVKCVMVITIQQ
jgi:hypothetical protein